MLLGPGLISVTGMRYPAPLGLPPLVIIIPLPYRRHAQEAAEDAYPGVLCQASPHCRTYILSGDRQGKSGYIAVHTRSARLLISCVCFA